jgi:hypothetical protein
MYYFRLWLLYFTHPVLSSRFISLVHIFQLTWYYQTMFIENIMSLERGHQSSSHQKSVAQIQFTIWQHMLYHLWVNISLNHLRFALSLSVGHKIECKATIIGIWRLAGSRKIIFFDCRYSSFQWMMRSLSVNQSYLLYSRWTSAICSDCCSWWSNASIVVSWTLNTNRTFNLYLGVNIFSERCVLDFSLELSSFCFW